MIYDIDFKSLKSKLKKYYLLGIDIKSGEDQIGTWTSTGIRYALNDSLIEVFECEIIKYIDLPFIRFKQVTNSV